MTSKEIHVHIVDEHNNVLPFILKALGSKKIRFEENMIIHIDSHPDLLLESNLKSDDMHEKSALLEKVSIESWLLPLAFNRHFTTIVWVKPEWSNQISEGVYHFHIGETIDGKLGVSAALFYFISAITYIPLDQMINPKAISLHVLSMKRNRETLMECKCKIIDLVKRHESNYIIDIDLDFFSTLNPFLNMYEGANMYDCLKKIYKFEEKELLDNPPSVVQDKRQNQLDTLEGIFLGLAKSNSRDDINRSIENLSVVVKESELISTLSNLISRLYEMYGKEVDWEMVHDAGTTIDDDRRALPHHRSSEEEIEDSIDSLSILLEKLPPPKMITVARSASDDYCPSMQVDFVQEKVCLMLSNLFQCLIKEHYLSLDEDIEERI